MPVRSHEASEPWNLVEPGWETSERENVADKNVWRQAWHRAQADYLGNCKLVPVGTEYWYREIIDEPGELRSQGVEGY